jgi:single-strand DNA-binding protein
LFLKENTLSQGTYPACLGEHLLNPTRGPIPRGGAMFSWLKFNARRLLMQKTTLIGNLGNDPELRDANGTPVCSFSVATTEQWKDQQGNKQKKTEWHKIVAWRNLANICIQNLKKGSKVYVEGKNQTRKWVDRNDVEHYITEIHAKEIEMLSNGYSGNEAPPSYQDDEPF